jgi:predicted metal-binding protein
MGKIVYHKGNKGDDWKCIVCFRHIAKLPPHITEEEEDREMIQSYFNASVFRAKKTAKKRSEDG